ncbi:hypothetical protein J2Z83_003560 [Virgibacillus natechei]|uniref:Uncharacterized protein n=1 Tax=Virgibacillus natechei TaxID=1216297 RepID=A0ABS4IM98_9BACI|nr:hypothetical protein [Virgibacillus natechei]MBP1971421.1 hypothetical protein [Virgibacillus natechei]UZD13791.1 hypothetical protein OLD84_04360 [Virgibacillus natechei]
MRKLFSRNVTPTNKHRPHWWFLSLFLAAIMVLLTLSSCASNTADKSDVDGVSDEVYEQLVQQYFFTWTTTEILLDDDFDGKKTDNSWIIEHELFEDAEQYAKEHDESHPFSFFPNPLLYEALGKKDSFTETEQKYIEKMEEFYESASRLNDMDEYKALQRDLKDSLNIKDSYNPFSEVEKKLSDS